MTEKFSHYDSADYLRTEEEVAAYLDACVEEGGDDPAKVEFRFETTDYTDLHRL